MKKILLMILVITNTTAYAAGKMIGWVNAQGMPYPDYKPITVEFTDKEYIPYGPTIAQFGNVPYITWRDNTGHYIHLIKRNGSKWCNIKGEEYKIERFDKKPGEIQADVSLIDNAIISKFADQQEILIDNNGTVYVAWKHYNYEIQDNCEIFVVKWNGSAWVSLNGLPTDNKNENISNSPGWSDLPYFTFDGMNNPTMAWRDGDSILFARWNGYQWVNAKGLPYYYNNAVVSQTTYFKGFPMTVFDSSNNPWILWSEDPVRGEKNVNIHIAHWNGSKWTSANGEESTQTNTIIARSDKGFAYPRMDLDSQGNPHVTWCERTESQTAIIYIKWDSRTNSWVNKDNYPFNSTNAVIMTNKESLFVDSIVMDNNDKLLFDISIGSSLHILRFDNTGFSNLDGTVFDSANHGINYASMTNVVYDSSFNPYVCFNSYYENELCFLKWSSESEQYKPTPPTNLRQYQCVDKWCENKSSLPWSGNIDSSKNEFYMQFAVSNIDPKATWLDIKLEKLINGQWVKQDSVLSIGEWEVKNEYIMMVSFTMHESLYGQYRWFARVGQGPATSNYDQINWSDYTAAGISDPDYVIEPMTPINPLNLMVEIRDGKPFLFWNASTTDGVSTYNIYRRNASGSYANILAAVNTYYYYDTNASEGETYYYVVTAVKDSAESAYSNEVTVKVPSPVMPVSVSPSMLEFGFINRGTSDMRQLSLTFNLSGYARGTIKADKKWLSVSPSSFDSDSGPVSILCTIKASELPGKGGIKNANITIETDSQMNYFASNNVKYNMQPKKIVVPVTVETQRTIDIELQINQKYGRICQLNVELDSPPFVTNGRTLVPVRFISESFGCNVQWDAAQKMITIRRFNQEIIMFIGKNEYYDNGNTKILQSPPVIVSGRTFVPLRAISEAFDANITWDEVDKKITCIYEPPDDEY